MESAIAREKALKEWKRMWKVELIEKDNPTWRDLYEEVLGMDSGFRRNDDPSRGFGDTHP